MLMRTLPILPATFWASSRRSRFSATRCALRASKLLRLSLVARSAFFFGSRKLRAKPGFTRTTSPIWPRRSIRSSRMTSTIARLLLQQIGQEGEEAGALDRLGELALLLGRDRGDAARHDLAALRQEALQQLHVLVVDLRRVGAGEGAGLAPPEEGPAPAGAAAAATFPAGRTLGRGHYSVLPSSAAAAAGRGSLSKPPRGSRGRRSPRSSSYSPSRRRPCSIAEGPSSSASTRTVR